MILPEEEERAARALITQNGMDPNEFEFVVVDQTNWSPLDAPIRVQYGVIVKRSNGRAMAYEGGYRRRWLPTFRQDIDDGAFQS